MNFKERVLTKLNVLTSDVTLPLHRAARGRHISQVRELIAAGVDIDARDGFGNTALHIASNQGYTEIVRELIEAGADIDIKSASGLTPVHLASSNSHPETVQMLVAAGAVMAGPTAVHGETDPDTPIEHEQGASSMPTDTQEDSGTSRFKFSQRRRGWIIGFVGTIALLLVVAIGIAAAENTGPSDTTRLGNTVTPVLSWEELAADAERVPYRSLFRFIEDHVGESVYYRGKVTQVIGGSGGAQSLRVGVSPTGYGVWDNDIMFIYRRGEGIRVLEDDIVEVVGIVEGLREYELVVGGTKTVPQIRVIKLRVQGVNSRPSG